MKSNLIKFFELLTKITIIAIIVIISIEIGLYAHESFINYH